MNNASVRVIIAVVFAIVGGYSGEIHADYQSRCASCHANTTPLRALPCVQNEVNNLPDSVGLSGSVRVAGNRPYLDYKVTNGMGGFSADANNGFTNLTAAERNAIVAEIAASCSVTAPSITSAVAPNGTVLSSYSHTVTTTSVPPISGNTGLNPAIDSTFPAGFTLDSGALPPGVVLNANTGLLSGTPTVGGFYSGVIRASNRVGSGATQSFNINIAKFNQTVSFGAAPAPTYSPGGTFIVSASATSGLAVTYSATGTCSVPNANVATIAISGGGACAVTATQAGSNTYNSASATQNITIAKANQTISFGAQTTATRTYSTGLTFALSPAATGGPLASSITHATNNVQICTIAATTITVGPLAGTCTVTATQNGNNDYNSISASQNIVINATVPSAPSINTTVPGNAQATFAFSSAMSDGGSPITAYRATCNPGNLFIDGPASPIILAGLTNMTTYTCTVSAVNPVGTTASAPVMVTPTDGSIPPGLTSPNSVSFTVGNAGTFGVTAVGTPTPTLSVAGTLPNGVTFTPATGLLAGTPALGTVGTYPLTYVAANGALPNATQPFTLTIGKRTQAISFNAIPVQTLTVINAQVPLSATASSGLPVSFTSLTTGVCSVSGIAVSKLTSGTCTIAANQPGGANHLAAAQVTQSFSINASGINVGQGQNDWFNGGGFLQFNACSTCHGSPTAKQLNAANAPGLINFVFSTNFVGQHSPGPFPLPPNSTQLQELAAYVGTFVPGTNPINLVLGYNVSSGFTIPNIVLGTGTFSSLSVVTPPTKGTVAFSGTTAIYTPFTGQTGADAFTYRATGNAGATETRTATVIIANPPLPAITNVLSTTGTAGTPMSFNLTATNTPTLFSAGGGLPPGLFLNTTTGLIYGTPTTPGTYAAMVTATNAGGTSLSATVVFNIAAVLAVSKAGSGSGLVVSSLAGINCGATCTATYSAFSGVTLTATPAMGSVFAGWSDSNCMGANTCSLTMNVNKTITATFNAIVAPDAPTLNSVTPGPGNATLVFSAPVNNGGAAISGYTATCVASGEATRTSFGSGTPLTVGALTGGVLYSCSLTATNAAGFTSSASASLTVTPAPANRSNIAPLLMLLLD